MMLYCREEDCLDSQWWIVIWLMIHGGFAQVC